MNILLELFLMFMKIGLFTFGGGYAMISVIEDICVDKKKWITHEEMMDVTVIAESTPGPIAINCATFVGYKIAGFFGALLATIGVVIPSFIIIFCISSFLDNFLEITIVANAFKGIKVGVGILILNVAINMIKKMPKKKFPIVIMTSSLVALIIITFTAIKISSITIMLMAAIIGIAYYRIEEKYYFRRN